MINVNVKKRGEENHTSISFSVNMLSCPKLISSFFQPNKNPHPLSCQSGPFCLFYNICMKILNLLHSCQELSTKISCPLLEKIPVSNFCLKYLKWYVIITIITLGLKYGINILENFWKRFFNWNKIFFGIYNCNCVLAMYRHHLFSFV